MIPCDSENSLIFCNSGIQIYQGTWKVLMVICAICMCANGTIVTDIFVGNKGNNKITELRTILQRESQNS